MERQTKTRRRLVAFALSGAAAVFGLSANAWPDMPTIDEPTPESETELMVGPMPEVLPSLMDGQEPALPVEDGGASDEPLDEGHPDRDLNDESLILGNAEDEGTGSEGADETFNHDSPPQEELYFTTGRPEGCPECRNFSDTPATSGIEEPIPDVLVDIFEGNATGIDVMETAPSAKRR